MVMRVANVIATDLPTTAVVAVVDIIYNFWKCRDDAD